jgi:hypothetical protein
MVALGIVLVEVSGPMRPGRMSLDRYSRLGLYSIVVRYCRVAVKNCRVRAEQLCFGQAEVGRNPDFMGFEEWEPAVGFEPTACCLRRSGQPSITVRLRPPSPNSSTLVSAYVCEMMPKFVVLAVRMAVATGPQNTRFSAFALP